jgi:transcriptional regulator with XRE-family HTH domain
VDASRPLRRLLRERGWTQDKLATETGIGRGTINAYCRGRRGLGSTNGRKIAAALGVDLSELGLSDSELSDDEMTALRAEIEAVAFRVARIEKLLQDRADAQSASERRRGRRPAS